MLLCILCVLCVSHFFMVGGICWLFHLRISDTEFRLLEFHLAGMRVCPCVLSDRSLCVGCEIEKEVSLVPVQFKHGVKKCTSVSTSFMCTVIFQVCPSLRVFLSPTAQIFCQHALFVQELIAFWSTVIKLLLSSV